MKVVESRGAGLILTVDREYLGLQQPARTDAVAGVRRMARVGASAAGGQDARLMFVQFLGRLGRLHELVFAGGRRLRQAKA